ncbi:MAG: formate/nitrite transporter family protein [Spirochaetales bacterium]|nr:formate/nitrite transporter family protein [Spirochaetales bacterium]
MKSILPPQEVSRSFIEVGKTKAAMPLGKLIGLGVLAGFFVGLAAHLATVVATGWVVAGQEALYGLKMLSVGMVFSTGLMMVLLPGSELFTGNCLMTIPLCAGEITLGGLLRNWTVVYLANLLGSLVLAYSLAGFTGLLAGDVGGTAIKTAWTKVALSPGGLSHWMSFFMRAIWCNFLVCIAVMMAAAAQDASGKILAVLFPIMAFVTSGFEHVVANMYFLPAGIIALRFPEAVEASGLNPEALSQLTWKAMVWDNFVPVTLGNILGGGILVGVLYWAIYLRPERKSAELS